MKYILAVLTKVACSGVLKTWKVQY